MEDNPDLLRARAQAYASELFPNAALPASLPEAKRPARLRLATSLLPQTQALFWHSMPECWPRTTAAGLKSNAYAAGPGLTEETARQISGSVSVFRRLDGTEAAIVGNLDIAVDLSGYSNGNLNTRLPRGWHRCIWPGPVTLARWEPPYSTI